MDTLALTTAAVLISLVIGVPLGIWAGVSDRFNAVVTPFLDFAQTMPTFVYLAPLTLLFLIGPATGVIATLIYAMPPTIRITAHGIRSVPRAAIEASESLGLDQGADPADRDASHGPAHHRHRHQPDHPRRAGHGDHRRPRRGARAWARPC